MSRRKGSSDTPLSVLQAVRIEVEKIEADNIAVSKKEKQQEPQMDGEIWRRFLGRFRIDVDGNGSSA